MKHCCLSSASVTKLKYTPDIIYKYNLTDIQRLWSDPAARNGFCRENNLLNRKLQLEKKLYTQTYLQQKNFKNVYKFRQRVQQEFQHSSGSDSWTQIVSDQSVKNGKWQLFLHQSDAFWNEKKNWALVCVCQFLRSLRMIELRSFKKTRFQQTPVLHLLHKNPSKVCRLSLRQKHCI